MPKAENLLKKALKAAPKKTMARSALEEQVCQLLVEAGKTQKKALKKVTEALTTLPCFAVRGDTVSYVKESGDETAAPSEPPKRKDPEAAEEAAPKKKQKKEAEKAAPPAKAAKGASVTGALSGNVKMMGTSEAEAFRTEHRIAVSADDGTEGNFRPVGGFADAGFSEHVLRAVKSFSKPTPIQAQCWPIMMAGRDCIGVAETGSGKTLAFFLPAMMHCAAKGVTGSNAGGSGPSVLILAPTRELAMQSDDVCRVAGKECGLWSVCIYGGVPKHTQRQAIKEGAQVVVATPGRLLDLHDNDRACELSNVTYLVLDEADRMLDMGFEKDVRAIISHTASKRRTVMFTATWPEEIRGLAAEFLDNPVRVNVGSVDLAANTRVTQTVEVIDGNKKEQRLIPLLNKYHKSRTVRGPRLDPASRSLRRHLCAG